MHQTSFKKRLDKVMYPIGLLGPLLMLPQILKIYMEQDASSIALSSWALFTIPVTVWIVYGLAHKEKVVVLCNVVWLIMYLLVIVGALLY